MLQNPDGQRIPVGVRAMKPIPFILFFVLAGILGGTGGCSKPTDVATLIQSADRHYEKREFEAAKIQYINALKIQQTNTHAMMRLGQVFFEQGQIQSAYSLLVRAKESHPNEVPLREALAIIYSAAGTNLWRSEVDAILQLQPTNEVAVMTFLRGSENPAVLADFTNTLASLRQRTGERAVYLVAEAELARRQGDKQGALQILRRAINLEPESLSALGAMGAALMAEGQKDEAMAQWAKASQISPPYGIARLRYAQVLLQEGKPDEAIKLLDEINAKAPEVLLAWTTRAEVAFKRKEYRLARTLLDRVTVQSPMDPPALRLRAQIDLAESKPADAIKTLESLAKALPRSAEIQYQLGVANLLNKEMDAAVQNLREAVRLDPTNVVAGLLLSELEIARGSASEAIGLLSGIARRAPNLEQARMLLGRAYRATGRLDDAIAVYTSMGKQWPSNAAPIFQLGLVLRQKGRNAEARTAFETCTQLTPVDPAPVQQLVGLDLEAKDPGSALKRIDALEQHDPKSSLPSVMRGTVLNFQRKTGEAEAAFKKALDLDPESQPALMALAQLYALEGKRDKALEELKRAINKDSKNLGALTLAGMLQSESQNYSESRATYEKALLVQPNSVLVLNNLANVLAESLNELDAGLAHASRARQLAPKNPVIADTLGWIEFKKRRYPEALRLLLEAAENLGGVPEVQYHLGMAHYMMGQEAPALIALSQSLKGGSPAKWKETASNYLAILQETNTTDAASVVSRLQARRREHPTDLIALTRLARAFASQGSYDQAQEAFEAALKANPGSTEASLGLARLLAEHRGNTSRALELARGARNASPGDATIGAAVGQIAYLAGDHPYAYSLLQESARRLSNAPQTTLNLARAAFSVSRISETTNLLNSLTQSDQSTISGQARTLLDLISAEKAPVAALPPILLLAESTLAKEPNHLEALYAQAIGSYRKSEFDQARARLETINSKFPSFAPAMRDLAVLYADRFGEDAKASTLAYKAREALPRDIQLTALLGRIASRKGDHRLAAQLLEDAAKTMPNDAELLYYLGVSQLGLKQTEAGKITLKKAIALAPTARFVADAQKLLEEPRTP